MVYLDFAKAFDKVPHSALINKLSRFGISGLLKQWFQSYLANRSQRVTLQGTKSNWLQVTSWVPQGSILGPLPFLAYDIPQCIQHHSKIAIFADDSKLYQIISKPSDKILFQQDLTQLSNWSHTWAMSLSIPKCKTLIISRKKSRPSREYHLQSQPKVSGHPQTKAPPPLPLFQCCYNNVDFSFDIFLNLQNNIGQGVWGERKPLSNIIVWDCRWDPTNHSQRNHRPGHNHYPATSSGLYT